MAKDPSGLGSLTSHFYIVCLAVSELPVSPKPFYPQFLGRMVIWGGVGLRKRAKFHILVGMARCNKWDV